jgi:hypothetical protein
MQPKELTYDQKKAAEAAFQGLPPNPKWSLAARAVYDGLVGAMVERPLGASSTGEGSGPTATATVHEESDIAVSGDEPDTEPAPSSGNGDEGPNENTSLTVSGDSLNRDQAIEAGILIDVTPVAHEVGLRLPVGISRPLWEIGITASHQIEDEDYEARVRDVLMALRLHLETAEITSPWIKFPALLSFPPETSPQVCSLYAVAHKDPVTPYSITLLLPHELPK